MLQTAHRHDPVMLPGIAVAVVPRQSSTCLPKIDTMRPLLRPTVLAIVLAASPCARAHAATARSPAPAAASPSSAVSAAAPAPAVLKQVESLLQRDPDAALHLGLPAWQAGTGGAAAHTALGLALMQAADGAKQRRQALAIGAQLRHNAMTPSQRLAWTGFMAADVWTTGKVADVRALAPDVAALDAEVADPRDAVAEVWRRLAASYLMLEDWNAGLHAAKHALAMAPRHPDRIDYTANPLIAVAYAEQDELPQAIAAMMAADRARKALRLPANPLMLQNFSALFMAAHNWKEAIVYGKRALAAHPQPAERISILGNLGGAYQKLGNLPEAMATYRQALAVARSNRLEAPGTLNNLADLLQHQHKPAQALPLLRQAASEYARTGQIANEATTDSNIGEALASLGQRAQAARIFDRSLALFARADIVQRRLELYPRMIDNLEALGRYREALPLFRAYVKLHDEHVSVTSRTQIAGLEATLELERKQTELARAQREHEAQQAELARAKVHEQHQRLLAYGMLGLLALITALAAWSLRVGRQRRRLNQALAAKNAEIEAQHRDLARLNAAIRRQSEEDVLTGLHNRRYGQDWLEHEALAHARAQRRVDPIAPTLLALVDLDHFKRINDNWGHAAGDQALVHFAGILRACARQSDVLVRWGGEEFLWICPATPMAEAARLFARVREQLQQRKLVIAGHDVHLTASIGFSLYPLWPGAEGDWALSLRIADAALYRAKSAGRDSWAGFGAGSSIATGPGSADALGDGVDALEARGWLVALGSTPATG